MLFITGLCLSGWPNLYHSPARNAQPDSLKTSRVPSYSTITNTVFSLFIIIIKRLNETARILLTVIRLAQKP